MALNRKRLINPRYAAFLAIPPLVLAQMCVPSDHPLASQSDTIEFDETQSASGFKVEEVKSGSAAPHLPFELSVDIISDQPLAPEDVEVTWTVSFVRPGATTQQLTYNYMIRWRQASVAN